MRTVPFTLLVALLLLGCSRKGSPAHATTRLPSKRPADFDLSEDNSGGMVQAGDSTHISAKGCQFEQWHGPNKVRAEFSLTPAELDELYATLRANKFDRIETRHDENVYDRGGVSISLEAGGKSYRVSDAGTDFVVKAWQSRFQGVLDAIDRVTKRAIEPKKVSVRFTFEPELAGKQVSLDLGSRATLERQLPAKGSSRDFEIPVRDLPGPYTLHVQATKARNYDGTVKLAAGRVFGFAVVSGALVLEGGPDGQQSRLPAKRPPDLTITERSGGGKVPRGYAISIDAKGCHYTRRDGPHKVEADFSLTPSELDKLYSTLKIYAFDRIETRRKKDAHDRGGIAITLSWDHQGYDVSDSGPSFVQPGWYEQWGNVVKAIEDATNHALAPKKISVGFHADAGK